MSPYSSIGSNLGKTFSVEPRKTILSKSNRIHIANIEILKKTLTPNRRGSWWKVLCFHHKILVKTVLIGTYRNRRTLTFEGWNQTGLLPISFDAWIYSLLTKFRNYSMRAEGFEPPKDEIRSVYSRFPLTAWIYSRIIII